MAKKGVEDVILLLARRRHAPSRAVDKRGFSVD